jgi:predicted dehydrogenase
MTAASKNQQGEIGVAVVGTGFGKKVHIPGLKAHPRTKIAAVYNRDLDKAKEIAESNDIPNACDNLTDILQLPEVQAVAISTPPFLHYEMAKQVLQAGKHLLLEKPVTLNVSEAKELYYLAKEKNLAATVDFEFRFVPGWLLFCELLAQNYVGNKRLITINWFGSSRANPDRAWNWYSQKEKGGGALGSLGSHTFDYIHWLFGEVSRVNAHFTTAIPQRPDATGEMKPVNSDDTCALMLELASGTSCQVSLSAVIFAPRTHVIEVYGDEGTLILASENQKDYVHGFRVWGGKAGKPVAEIEIPNRLTFPKNYADGRISGFLRVVDQWVEAINSGESTTPSLREGVYSQLLMDKSHESNQTSNWVNVPSLNQIVSS